MTSYRELEAPERAQNEGSQGLRDFAEQVVMSWDVDGLPNVDGFSLKLIVNTGQHPHRVTSLIRNTPLLGPYSGTIPRALWCT